MNLERKKPDSGVQGLPSGWKREEVVRRKGLSAGKIDVFYCRWAIRLTSCPDICKFVKKSTRHM